MQRGAGDRSPAIELAIGPIVAGLQGFGLEQRGAIDDVAGVVESPVAGEHAAFADHAGVQLGSGIGGLNVEGRGGDAVVDGPVYGATEHVFAVVIHAKDKAAVDHDAERVEAVGYSFVVAAEVLPFVASL